MNEIRKFEISIGEFEGEGTTNIPSGLLRRERKASAVSIGGELRGGDTTTASIAAASEESFDHQPLRRASRRRTTFIPSQQTAIQEDRNEDKEDSIYLNSSSFGSAAAAAVAPPAYNKSHFSRNVPPPPLSGSTPRSYFSGKDLASPRNGNNLMQTETLISGESSVTSRKIPATKID